MKHAVQGIEPAERGVQLSIWGEWGHSRAGGAAGQPCQAAHAECSQGNISAGRQRLKSDADQVSWLCTIFSVFP